MKRRPSTLHTRTIIVKYEKKNVCMSMCATGYKRQVLKIVQNIVNENV